MRSLIPWIAAITLVWVGTATAQTYLDYRQQQSVRNAGFHLNRVESRVKQVEEATAKWQAGDPTISIRDVDTYLSWLEQAADYLDNAAKRLEGLPTHPDVDRARARHTTAHENLVALQHKLQGVHNKVGEVVQQGGTAQYQQDLARLKEINKMYANPNILNSDPERAAEVIKQIPHVRQERRRIASTYAALLQQPTVEARQMQDVLNYFDRVFGSFEQRLQAYINSTPAQIEAKIDEAKNIADEGVRDEKTAYFGEHGGVPQRFQEARDKLIVLSAAAPQAAATRSVIKKLEDTENQVIKMVHTLETRIVEQNRVPKDAYSGNDKAELVKIIRDKWDDDGNGKDILRSGINANGWKRNTRWEWFAGAWHKVDKSKTQGFVVVKDSDDVAVIHYVWLSKDHLANDHIKPYFLYSPKETPEVQRKVLLHNIN